MVKVGEAAYTAQVLERECITLMNSPKSQRSPPAPAKDKGDKPDVPDKAAAQISEHIGRELRSMFDDVVSEPVPDRFQKLLEELEQKQSKD
jgi:hypothetical protein